MTDDFFRRMWRKGRRELVRWAREPRARAQRLEAISLIVRGSLMAEVLDFEDHRRRTRSLARRQMLARDLLTSIAEALGGLAGATRGSARLVILQEARALLPAEMAQLVQQGRFRVRQPKSEPSAELEELLMLTPRERAAAQVEAYLSRLSIGQRLARAQIYGLQLVRLLGSERTVAFFEDAGRYTDIEATGLLAPFLEPRIRHDLLTKGVDLQLRHGDESSLVDLVCCARVLPMQAAARLVSGTFGVFGLGGIRQRLRRGGDLYWAAPLFRRLGRDEALLVAAREVMALRPWALDLPPINEAREDVLGAPGEASTDRKVAPRASGRRR